jgi:RNA polymerase sigma-70 factor, ECF subfamily
MNNLHKKFSKIYDKNLSGIYRFIYFKVSSPQIAEDLCSETFLKAWNAFNRDYNHFEEGIRNPRAFLYQIARNLVIDYYKQKDRTQTVSIDNVVMADNGPSIEEKVAINSDMDNIMLAMKGIKQEYQDIIIWHYIEGLSAKEISQIINKSYGTTRVMLHRALSSLKERVEEA